MSQTPVPAARPLKKAAKPARIFRLYPEPVSPSRPAAQAANFLQILRETVPVSGHWLIVADLSRCYLEIAQQEGWPELRWAVIGRELAKLTQRKTVKRDGKRYVAYLLK